MTSYVGYPRHLWSRLTRYSVQGSPAAIVWVPVPDGRSNLIPGIFLAERGLGAVTVDGELSDSFG